MPPCSATRAASVRIRLQADVRRDVNSVYGGNTTGRVGYGFEIVRGLKLRALAGTSASARRPSTTCTSRGYGRGFACGRSAAAASSSG